MKRENEMIAVCGLDCSGCDIRKATNNPSMTQEITDWFKKNERYGNALKRLRNLKEKHYDQ